MEDRRLFGHHGVGRMGMESSQFIQQFELKLATGEVVTWEGTSPVAAARRYVAEHRSAVVVAWRYAERTGVFPYVNTSRIIEPGERKINNEVRNQGSP